MPLPTEVPRANVLGVGVHAINMAQAVGLYRRLGFEPTAPYVFNPIEGAMFFARSL